MLTRVLGVDLQQIYMTMLALAGLYLVLRYAPQLNTLVRTASRAALSGVVIAQGRTPTSGLTP
jgi:hypothetical protein